MEYREALRTSNALEIFSKYAIFIHLLLLNNLSAYMFTCQLQQSWLKHRVLLTHDFFSRYDLIIDATDNVPSRYMINDCCVVLGKVKKLLSGNCCVSS